MSVESPKLLRRRRAQARRLASRSVRLATQAAAPAPPHLFDLMPGPFTPQPPRDRAPGRRYGNLSVFYAQCVCSGHVHDGSAAAGDCSVATDGHLCPCAVATPREYFHSSRVCETVNNGARPRRRNVYALRAEGYSRNALDLAREQRLATGIGARLRTVREQLTGKG